MKQQKIPYENGDIAIPLIKREIANNNVNYRVQVLVPVGLAKLPKPADVDLLIENRTGKVVGAGSYYRLGGRNDWFLKKHGGTEAFEYEWDRYDYECLTEEDMPHILGASFDKVKKMLEKTGVKKPIVYYPAYLGRTLLEILEDEKISENSVKWEIPHKSFMASWHNFGNEIPEGFEVYMDIPRLSKEGNRIG